MEVRMSMAMEIPDFRAASVCLKQMQTLKLAVVILMGESNGRQVALDFATGFKQNCRSHKNFSLMFVAHNF